MSAGNEAFFSEHGSEAMERITNVNKRFFRWQRTDRGSVKLPMTAHQVLPLARYIFEASFSTSVT